jgi:hypothetical protein
VRQQGRHGHVGVCPNGMMEPAEMT